MDTSRTSTRYAPIQQIKDSQPIRAACFHPSGEAFVVGTNSKALKICRYPNKDQLKQLILQDVDIEGSVAPEILFTCLHIHCGSVYSTAFNRTGDLLASGSNDQTVHLMKYNPEKHCPDGSEYKFNMHTGTVRDVCFLNQSNSSLLISAGAGDFGIHLTDCEKMKQSQIFKGHHSTVMSLHTCDELSNVFVSGSLDGTIRFWDLRSKGAICTVRKPLNTAHTLDGSQSESATNGKTNDLRLGEGTITEPNGNGSISDEVFEHKDNTLNGSNRDGSSSRHLERDASPPKGSPVGVVRLDPSGRLLASGHQDGSCMLYDIRSERMMQSFEQHSDQIRTLNFSPNSYYLLSGSYDHKVRLTDLQGVLSLKLPSVELVDLNDKVVQTAWHPDDYNFVTTCADGTATLWAIADEFEQWVDSIRME